MGTPSKGMIMKKAIYSLAIAGSLGTAIWAQDTANPVAGQQPSPAANILSGATSKISTLNKATSFVGANVINQTGEHIGKVQDLVFDLGKGELSYAVLALAGENSRKVAVPVRSLKIADGEKRLVLNMSESVLAAAEGITEGEWPATDVFAVGGPAEGETGSGSSADVATEKRE